MKSQDWYDYPQYYDLAFRNDNKPEADFIEAACKKYCLRPPKKLLEPACGGGRLVVELASRGYQMTGFDLNQRSLAFARKQLAKRGLTANIFHGDMTDFDCGRTFDGAFNTFNTFRILNTEEAAESHLKCVARALRPGGIYVLGMHLLPPDADEECTERWTARTGKTKVTFTLKVTHTDRKARIEKLRVNMRVSGPRFPQDLKVATEFEFRMYTAGQMRRLLAKIPEFELCDIYDFGYDINQPLVLNNEISDTVFILRRRA